MRAKNKGDLWILKAFLKQSHSGYCWRYNRSNQCLPSVVFCKCERKYIGLASSISVNGMGWKSGSGMLLGLMSGKVNWDFQGIGVLALGIACIAVVGGAAAAAGGLLAWRNLTTK